MGRSRNTNFTLSPYLASTWLIAGWTRLQYGQWKSENSMIVTGAVAEPRTGAPAVATVERIIGGAARNVSMVAVARRLLKNSCFLASTRWAVRKVLIWSCNDGRAPG